jgi:hypothetical protein
LCNFSDKSPGKLGKERKSFAFPLKALLFL